MELCFTKKLNYHLRSCGWLVTRDCLWVSATSLGTLQQRKQPFLTSVPLPFHHHLFQLAVPFSCPLWFLHEVCYLCAVLCGLMSHNCCTHWLCVDVQKAQREMGSCRRILEIVKIGPKGGGINCKNCFFISFHRRLE